ncbi:MAG TPA: hypothetical protein VHZ55_20215, partial [Bryobacteraceae bacterium]|nr:hypothetical protein [Bryobacteraceae bacterium]
LYAWSNVRAEYNAASSFQAAKDVDLSSYGGAWGGYGFSGFANPGWMWNGGMNSWAWLPGNAAFFSPFGYGFYGPGLVAYAPVVYAPIYGGGYGYGGGGAIVNRNGVLNRKNPVGTVTVPGRTTTAAVPVNPGHPPAVGQFSNSLASSQAARTAAARSFASSGFRTGNGGVVSAGHASAMFSGAGRAGSSGSHGSAPAGSGGSGFASSGAGHSSGGFSGASAAGGHSGGGGSAGGGGGGGHH